MHSRQPIFDTFYQIFSNVTDGGKCFSSGIGDSLLKDFNLFDENLLLTCMGIYVGIELKFLWLLAGSKFDTGR